MNDSDLIEALRTDPDPTPLDPAKVIAGARRRRRTRGLLTAGVASAGVLAVVMGGATTAGSLLGGNAAGLPVASGPQPTETPRTDPGVKPRTVPRGYVFQNKPQVIAELPPNGSARIAPGYDFRTDGTRWAIVSRLPANAGEPFGWRQTIGNSNLGDGTALSIQSTGAGSGRVLNTVVKAPRATTVVYTLGQKAWYAKVNRLGGIPGWIQASAYVNGVPMPSTSTKTGAKGATTITRGSDPRTGAVFLYDSAGKLLGKFPADAKDPLAK